MPDKKILGYYEQNSKKILPFLADRPIAVRHTFGDLQVYKRHEKNKKKWIYIDDEEKLISIVSKHGYEFYPHLEGKKDFWFVLDVDLRDFPIRKGIRVIREVCSVLEERHVNFLLTFSGSNGFHFHWKFEKEEMSRKKWDFLKSLIRNVQKEVERRLSGTYSFFEGYLPKGDPITELNSLDKKSQKSILFDELIIKDKATIRSPFSIHMKHRWVDIPVDPKKIEDFKPETDASMEAAIKIKETRLPFNPVSKFLKSPWI